MDGKTLFLISVGQYCPTHEEVKQMALMLMALGNEKQAAATAAVVTGCVYLPASNS